MVKPVLQAMVLADHVYQDRTTGKFVIAGTLSRFAFAKAKAAPPKDSEGRSVIESKGMAGPPYLYLALLEVYEQVPLAIKFVDLSDARVLVEGRIAVASGDPLNVAEYVVAMPPQILVKKPGIYSLEVHYEGEILGSWRLTVEEIEQTDKMGDNA